MSDYFGGLFSVSFLAMMAVIPIMIFQRRSFKTGLADIIISYPNGRKALEKMIFNHAKNEKLLAQKEDKSFENLPSASFISSGEMKSIAMATTRFNFTNDYQLNYFASQLPGFSESKLKSIFADKVLTKYEENKGASIAKETYRDFEYLKTIGLAEDIKDESVLRAIQDKYAGRKTAERIFIAIFWFLAILSFISIGLSYADM